MFSRIVEFLSHEIWGIYETLPVFFIWPHTLWIYPKIAYNKVDLPEPTFPTTETN